MTIRPARRLADGAPPTSARKRLANIYAKLSPNTAKRLKGLLRGCRPVVAAHVAEDVYQDHLGELASATGSSLSFDQCTIEDIVENLKRFYSEPSVATIDALTMSIAEGIAIGGDLELQRPENEARLEHIRVRTLTAARLFISGKTQTARSLLIGVGIFHAGGMQADQLRALRKSAPDGKSKKLARDDKQRQKWLDATADIVGHKLRYKRAEEIAMLAQETLPAKKLVPAAARTFERGVAEGRLKL